MVLLQQPGRKLSNSEKAASARARVSLQGHKKGSLW